MGTVYGLDECSKLHLWLNVQFFTPILHGIYSKDQVLVIGAHWDTYGMSPGFNDNGSGVAAILEIARILASATCYRVGENTIYLLLGKKWQGSSLRFFQV